VDLPRTLKATTRTVNNVLGAPYVWEATSTMQFQPQETRLANAETLQQTIERIRTRLEAQGYERTPNSA
jgi:exonuclease VII large subunit